jgi:hypothetical protein
MGMKIVCLEGDIMRRIIRSRPAAIADLYVLKNCGDILIPKMEIPKQCWENGQLVFYETTPRMTYFLKKVCTYLKRNYRMSTPVEDLFDFLNIPEETRLEIVNCLKNDPHRVNNRIRDIPHFSPSVSSHSTNVEYDNMDEYM